MLRSGVEAAAWAGGDGLCDRCIVCGCALRTFVTALCCKVGYAAVG